MYGGCPTVEATSQGGRRAILRVPHRWLLTWTANTLLGRRILYVSTTTILIVFVASLAMLDAERHAAGANIRSYGNAAWWAISTISTVGYGDRYPVTGEGRLVAAALMLAGIALLGVVTAAVASWFIERVGAVQEAETQTRAEVDELLVEVRALRAELGNHSRKQGPSHP